MAGGLGINGHGYIAGVHPKVGGGLLGLKKRLGLGGWGCRNIDLDDDDDDEDDDDDDDDDDDVWFLWGETHMLERSSNLNHIYRFVYYASEEETQQQLFPGAGMTSTNCGSNMGGVLVENSPFFAKGSNRAGNWLIAW